jgi:hypothetical protein
MSTGPSGYGGVPGPVPGYEFEVPRGPRRIRGPDSPHEAWHAAEPAPGAPSPRQAGILTGIVAVMRARNWALRLALPILAAIAVGISAVVITGGGGGGGNAPSALAAGFPPARLAVAEFGGGTEAAQPVLAAVAASAATEVVAGSAGGGPALWVSADGGSSWKRAPLAGPPAVTAAGSGSLSGVAHGQAGWLAVGRTQAGTGGPLVIGSPDGTTWRVATGAAGLRAAGPTAAAMATAVAAAVAAGPAGYVIVGHRGAGTASNETASNGAAWYSAGLSGWHAATIASLAGSAGNAQLTAVTATAAGFAAVGRTGSGASATPAAWVSATGRAWRQVAVAVPGGAASAALDFVAAAGREVAAVGTVTGTDGSLTPFAEVSADSGATWTATPLPAAVAASGSGPPGTGLSSTGGSGSTTVTALTVAGGGFTATGTVSTGDGTGVVIWTRPAHAAGWSAVAPQGTGLAAPGTQNAITALTAQGVTLTGVGFTAALTAHGEYGVPQPTLWQSPVRP